jgi:single-stranded-DNA-specific exonuclease
MLTTIGGIAKGSARSIPGFDIYRALLQCSEHILQFGGHKYAAGLSVELEKLPQFREAFTAVAKEQIGKDMLVREIVIDNEIDLSELTPKFARVLSQIAPFGPGNTRPVFALRGVDVYGTPRIVGNNHLRFKVNQGSRVVDAIGFNLGDHLPSLQANGSGVDLAFSIDEGEYAGQMVPQLKIRDLKIL